MSTKIFLNISIDKLRRQEYSRAITNKHTKGRYDMDIRKGRTVKYIGTHNKHMIGKTFKVISRHCNSVELYAPIEYRGGEVHNEKVYMSVCDFEVVK